MRRTGTVAARLAALAVSMGLAATSVAEIRTLVCDIRGDQAVPATPSLARGCGRFTIDTDANTLDYYIVFDSSFAETAAHIHGMAGPGANAGVVHGLPAGSPKTGTWNYGEAQEADILAGRTYVNIHSAAFPAGEIRGQICSMVATLEAGQEVPPVVCPTAIGWGVFNIDVCNNTLDYHINMTGALCGVETAAHIHGAATHGANAGVLHGLPAGNPKIGSWNYAEAQEADILRGRTYVNIHSTLHVGGNARGQITPIIAPIDGSQQVPANASLATGTGYLSINEATDVLGYHFAYFPLVSGETAAHIHGFAPPGANAGVVHGLPAANPKLGTWAYPAGDEANILADRTYINIHSVAFPGGEIRGQLNIQDLEPCPPPCPWDCGPPPDGNVDTVDFLELLAQWGGVGTSCDFDSNGVDTVDFLALLAAWGPCP